MLSACLRRACIQSRVRGILHASHRDLINRRLAGPEYLTEAMLDNSTYLKKDCGRLHTGCIRDEQKRIIVKARLSRWPEGVVGGSHLLLSKTAQFLLIQEIVWKQR